MVTDGSVNRFSFAQLLKNMCKHLTLKFAVVMVAFCIHVRRFILLQRALDAHLHIH